MGVEGLARASTVTVLQALCVTENLCQISECAFSCPARGTQGKELVYPPVPCPPWPGSLTTPQAHGEVQRDLRRGGPRWPLTPRLDVSYKGTKPEAAVERAGPARHLAGRTAVRSGGDVAHPAGRPLGDSGCVGRGAAAAHGVSVRAEPRGLGSIGPAGSTWARGRQKWGVWWG